MDNTFPMQICQTFRYVPDEAPCLSFAAVSGDTVRCFLRIEGQDYALVRELEGLDDSRRIKRAEKGIFPRCLSGVLYDHSPPEVLVVDLFYSCHLFTVLSDSVIGTQKHTLLFCPSMRDRTPTAYIFP